MMSILKNKKGFGIPEILVAALVLGFMYTALLNMHGVITMRYCVFAVVMERLMLLSKYWILSNPLG